MLSEDVEGKLQELEYAIIGSIPIMILPWICGVLPFYLFKFFETKFLVFENKEISGLDELILLFFFALFEYFNVKVQLKASVF